MESPASKFLKDGEAKSFDRKHRLTIKYNISRYNASVAKGLQQFEDLPSATKKAALIKHKVLENLDNYLLNFERNFKKNGGTVYWASDSSDASAAIGKILKNGNVNLVVKSKSMTTEETGVVPYLEANGIEAVETDLGEYIVQISGDKPYHIVTPVMHRSALEIAEIYHNKFGLSPDSTPGQITAFTRSKLRKKFLEAGACITGANFLIADTGSVVLTENEGNGVMSFSWAPIHIILAGIEKIIPSLEDLNLFLPLLASRGTGQMLTVYNSIVSGQGQQLQKSDFSAARTYVILLDNGRTNLLRTLPQRRALSCIRCGACLNVCPVYKNIGGHSYATVYSGPIGAVITPHLKNFRDYMHLSYASSLCGKCSEVCPAGINLHQLLLHNRNYAVKNRHIPRMERIAIFAWKKTMMNRKLIDKPPYAMKKMFFNKAVQKLWGKRRSVPEIKKNSFRLDKF